MSNILVADTWNMRCQRFDAEGNFLGKFGVSGNGDGAFNLPMNIAVDAAGNIYVTDYGNKRVQKWDTDFNFLGWWGKGNVTSGWHAVGSGELGVSGTADGEFTAPYAIAVDSEDNIYVTDPCGWDSNWWGVQKFDSSGNFLLKFASWGIANGQLKKPFGITIDGNDEIYVSDQEPGAQARIQVYNTSGSYQRKFGTGGVGNGQFWRATGMAVEDDNSKFFVCDEGNNRIQRLTTVGVYEAQWASDSFDMAIDPQDQLYCADDPNNRIEVFDVDGTPLFTFGTFGNGDGQLDNPRGVCMDAGAQTFYQTLDATTTPLAIVTKKMFQTMEATTTPTALILKNTKIILAATTTPVVAMARNIKIILAATTTPLASFVREVTRNIPTTLIVDRIRRLLR